MEPRRPALQEHLVLLSELFERSPGFIAVLVGPEHIFEYANANFRALHDNRPLIGRPVRQAVPEAVRQGNLAILDQVFKTRASYSSDGASFVFERPNGNLERIQISFVYLPLINDADQVLGILVEANLVEEMGRPSRKVLSVVEARMLKHLAQGMTAAEVGTVMGYSTRTIQTYMQLAAHKLNAENSTHAVVEAIRLGEIRVW